MGYQLDWSILWKYRLLLWSGLGMTCQLVGVASLAALGIGILVGVMRQSRTITLRLLTRVYVEVNRNIPLVVKLFVCYFVLAIPAIPAAIIGLVIHQSAYIAEDVRAAIQAIPRGQPESALSTGLSRWMVAYYVTLPQALRMVLPALTNEFVELLKNSSVAMVISVEELTFTTEQINYITFRGFEVATGVTFLYFTLSWLVSEVTRRCVKPKPGEQMISAYGKSQ